MDMRSAFSIRLRICMKGEIKFLSRMNLFRMATYSILSITQYGIVQEANMYIWKMQVCLAKFFSEWRIKYGNSFPLAYFSFAFPSHIVWFSTCRRVKCARNDFIKFKSFNKGFNNLRHVLNSGWCENATSIFILFNIECITISHLNVFHSASGCIMLKTSKHPFPSKLLHCYL